MYARNAPVYHIKQFTENFSENDFYVNTTKEHLARFNHVSKPHRHDHFLTIICKEGSGSHYVDFVEYPIRPRCVFTIAPGQTHQMQNEGEATGFVLMHSREFYEVQSANRRLHNFPFYNPMLRTNVQVVTEAEYQKLEWLFQQMIEEFRASHRMKCQMLHALLDLVYSYLLRIFTPEQAAGEKKLVYLEQVLKFEMLIEANYRKLRSAAAYAELLGIGVKHLNRICVATLGKTSTQLITERVVLEAKRNLTFSEQSVEQIAIELGYFDPSYFIRFFKKQTGKTPLEFKNRSLR